MVQFLYALQIKNFLLVFLFFIFWTETCRWCSGYDFRHSDPVAKYLIWVSQAFGPMQISFEGFL